MVELIKKLCEEQGIKLADLENACKIGERTIYRWDSNAPSIDKVKRVADVLGVTVNDLLEYPEAPVLSSKERRLLQLFHQLNEDGQDKVLDYIEDIAPRYIKNHSVEPLEKEA